MDNKEWTRMESLMAIQIRLELLLLRQVIRDRNVRGTLADESSEALEETLDEIHGMYIDILKKG